MLTTQKTFSSMYNNYKNNQVYLSSAGLAVGKDTHIVPVHDRHNQMLGVFKYIRLGVAILPAEHLWEKLTRKKVKVYIL